MQTQILECYRIAYRYRISIDKKTNWISSKRSRLGKNTWRQIELAKMFYNARMDKGITIALQSMNPNTLEEY